MFWADTNIEFGMRIDLIDISPYSPEQLQPASYDLTLGRYWRFPSEPRDVKHEMTDDGFLLPPGDFILLHTAERITLSSQVIGFVLGKSSRAREGFQIEAAGLVDPGFSGELVLEVKNLLPDPNDGGHPVWAYQNHLRIKPGMKIAQIAFADMRSAPLKPYGHPDLGSHYQGQVGPVGSRDR